MRKLDVRKELNRSRTRAVNATKTRKYYTATDKEVKKSVRKDKLDYNANMAKQTIEAAGQGNLSWIWSPRAMQQQQTDKPVKEKNGSPLTTTEEQFERWVEHVGELSNRPTPNNQSIRLQQATTDIRRPNTTLNQQKPSKLTQKHL